jgi:membrane protease YdiL (CAAX protease family)
MDEPKMADAASEDARETSTPRSRWPTIAAWIAIGLLVAVAAAGQRWRPRNDQPATAGKPGEDLAVFNLQARYMVGAASMMPHTASGLYRQAQALDTGSVDQRVRFVVLAGELAGPQQALAKLDELDGKIVEHAAEVPADLKPVPDLLRRIFENRKQDVPPDTGLSDADRRDLIDQLGWFGELALHPPPNAAVSATGDAAGDDAAGDDAIGDDDAGDDAIGDDDAGEDDAGEDVAGEDVAGEDAAGEDAAIRRAVVAPAQRLFIKILGAFVVAGGVGVLGLAGLVALLVVMAWGWLRDPFLPPSGHAGIYAETFAVWLFLFIALNLVPTLLGMAGVPEVPDNLQLLAAAGLSSLSLLALAWPCLRGIPWSQVRRDIGWTTGRGLLIEPLAGLGAYVMSIPLVGLGLLLTLIAMWMQQALGGGGTGLGEFDRTVTPSHPIVPLLASGDRWLFLQALLLASVAAPIIEETAFRGVLYRHLRDATGRGGRMRSFLCSAVLNGVIFALIHPQGLVAVPALTCVAVGLTLAREWRGTLLPSIVLHGVHNGLLLLLLVAILS